VLTFLCFRGIQYIKSTDSILFDGDNQVDCATVFVADGRADSSSVALLDALWGCDVQQGMTPKSTPQLMKSDCQCDLQSLFQIFGSLYCFLSLF
jgi:hypothetical protein